MKEENGADVEAADVGADRRRRAERMLDELAVPHRPQFTPSQLAQDVGGSARAWQSACGKGQISATRDGRGWHVTMG